MKKTLAALLVTAALAGAAQAGQTVGTETYDLLFKNGTLDAVAPEATLVYSRETENRGKPESGPRDSGEIAISFDETAEKKVAELQFRQGEKHRNLGSFPASVGNPMIMFFYETVVRDMAEIAGGSPFYIRNRVKDALIQPAEMVEGEAELNGETVPVTTLTLRPFADDPNREKMKGFGDLTLTVTMSEEVPGWYLSLAAEAPHPIGGAPMYVSDMRFERLESGQ
ncbi:hypothetical protein [Litorisediminicola beolgyonensis]|uniref:Nickel uptake substrate-specific transmembrane region n=1 Tax=Litorisediminicola beolgyonensis TaxID=1173614 RepID=A0ABW3ZNJ3_9RHOB